MNKIATFYSSPDNYKTLCDWMNRHDLPSPKPDSLCDFGLIVNDAAIGFLFKTNSKTAYIDNLVTNPDKSSDERNVALTILLKELDLSARAFGFTSVSILSDTNNMDKRLFELGYKNHGAYSLYYKETGRI